MREQEPEDRSRQEREPDFLEKRGFTWGLLVALLVATLIVVLVLAYLITVRNLPPHSSIAVPGTGYVAASARSTARPSRTG